MTTEELLKPRWKVITDWPMNRGLKVGDIIFAYEGDMTKASIYKYNPYRIEPDKYPALFKKLDWWKERKVEDMPEYIKRIKSGNVFRVYWYNLEYNEVEYHSIDDNYITEPLDRFLPSNHDEYENLLNR